MPVSISGSGPVTGLTSIASPTTLNGLTIPTLGFGKVLQVASATKTDTFSTGSTSFTDITGLSVTITPSSTSSKIFIVAMVNAAADFGANVAQLRLSGGNSGSAVGDAAGSRTQAMAHVFSASDEQVLTVPMIYLDSPVTTSATTYKVQMRASGGTVYVNRSTVDSDAASNARLASTITVIEVGP